MPENDVRNDSVAVEKYPGAGAHMQGGHFAVGAEGMKL